MNKQFSVFLLFLRHSAWPILALSLLTAAAEAILFRVFLPGDAAQYSLEAALYATGTPIRIALLLGFAATLGLLLGRKGESKGRMGYTLDRLNVPHGQLIALQSLYNFLAILLFWALQIVAILAMFLLYQNAGGTVGPQTFYMACWQDAFVHAFLPLEDWPRWLCNLVLVIALAVVLACASAQQRRQKNPVAILFLIGLVCSQFLQPNRDTTGDVIVAVLALILAGFALHNALTLLSKEDDPLEEIDTL